MDIFHKSFFEILVIFSSKILKKEPSIANIYIKLIIN